MKKTKIFEIVWYSLCGAVALWGLTYVALGLIATFLEVKASDNVLAIANENFANVFKLGFLPWGLIIISVAAVAAIIVLLVVGKKVDREQEKALRRQARRQGLSETTPTADDIIDAQE